MECEVKILTDLRLLENLISSKTVSQITTFSKNLKIGQTVHGLISSLVCRITLRYNRLNYIAISKHRLKKTELLTFFKNAMIEEINSRV